MRNVKGTTVISSRISSISLVSVSLLLLWLRSHWSAGLLGWLPRCRAPWGCGPWRLSIAATYRTHSAHCAEQSVGVYTYSVLIVGCPLQRVSRNSGLMGATANWCKSRAERGCLRSTGTESQSEGTCLRQENVERKYSELHAAVKHHSGWNVRHHPQATYGILWKWIAFYLP